MDIMPISVVIFGSIPEAILIVWAGLLLLGKRPSVRKLLLLGIIQGILSYFIRRYIDLGPHMIAQLLTIVLLTFFIFKVNLATSFISIILSFVIVVLVEGTTMAILDLDMVYVLSIGWKRILFFLPHNLALIGVIYMCNKYNVSLLSEFDILNRIVR